MQLKNAVFEVGQSVSVCFQKVISGQSIDIFSQKLTTLIVFENCRF